jgi:hypothetical protein
MGSVSERRIRSIKGELLIWKSIFQFFLDLDLASNSSIKLLTTHRPNPSLIQRRINQAGFHETRPSQTGFPEG